MVVFVNHQALFADNQKHVDKKSNMDRIKKADEG
jgi:hypothetical protein